MGIDTTRYKVLAFVISAALAGVAGGLSGQLFANPLNPQNLNFVKSIEVIVMIVLGGHRIDHRRRLRRDDADDPARSAAGVRSAVSRLRMVLYALLLILLMIFRPQGLFGRREFSWSWLRLPTPPGRPSTADCSRRPNRALLEARNVTKRFGGLDGRQGARRFASRAARSTA